MTSRPVDLFLAVVRDGQRTLGSQIEDQLRCAIRSGALRPATTVPSTRDLARQLDVSRPIVVNAYAQLSAEGYLELRRGARPRVSSAARRCEAPAATSAFVEAPLRFDFRPGAPDLSAFPRAAWLRCLRDGLAGMSDADLGYTDPHGSGLLRSALSDYLGRVRGVMTDPSRVLVTSGFAQGRALIFRALASHGARRIAIEDPSNSELRDAVAPAGLRLVPIPVDDHGIRVDMLARSSADAVVITPAHQYPTGAVMSGERRAALLAWLRDRNAIAIEDDYDAEYRYDRAPVGALQSLDPDRIVYAGTTSKTLAPALRLGWLVVPPRLLNAVMAQQLIFDFGGPRIEQHAFAHFLARGELDRHLRRMRGRYRVRRDALMTALRESLPQAAICGVAAGLHATVRLPDGHDELAIRDAARQQGIGFTTMNEYRVTKASGPPTLVLGYGRCSEETIHAGVRELATVIRHIRRG
ncbi:MAG: PLP-dependent aminotransferase family protein [Gemmatimonadaceae bacterium]|nr:PLP-dependent aminotransferase family protein [Gemmatimonadaceae bacterium]